MAMIGTGANIRYNHYLTVYYSTMDLNAVANGSSWIVNDDVKMLNGGHCYNSFLPSISSSSPADQHLLYGKEVLKQTMLKHEAIFKDQIYELHRLYRRQRELMDEMKKNNLNKDRIPLETSHSIPVLSHISSDYVQKTCSLPWLNPAGSQTSISAAENILAPSVFNGGKRKQVDPDPAQAEGHYKESDLLESKCIKSRKMLFDLELLPDEYINSGEEESLGEENVHKVPEAPSSSCKTTSEVVNYSTKPILGSSGLNSVSQGDKFTRNSPSRIINCITDLNKPIKLEEDAASGADDFLGPAINHKNIPVTDSIDFSGRTNSGCQAVSKDMTYSRTHSELASFPLGASTGKLSPSSQSAHVEFKETPELSPFSLLDKTSRKPWNEKEIYGLESTGKNQDLFHTNHLESIGTSYMQSSQLVRLADTKDSLSSLISSWKKSMHDSGQNPIAVQALPCFTNSIKLAKSSRSSTVSSPGCDSATFLRGGLCHGSESESNTPEACPISVNCGNMNRNGDVDLASEQHSPAEYVKTPDLTDAKSAKDMNLNLMPASCPDVAVSQSLQFPDGENKLPDSLSGLPWLKANPYKEKPGKGLEGSTEIESGFLQSSSACICDLESENVEASYSASGTLILENPIKDKFPSSSDHFSFHASPSSSHRTEYEDFQNSEKYGVIDINLGSGKQLVENGLGIEIGFKDKLSCCRERIDLNSCINEDESSQTSSSPINLEAPVSPENKECSPPRGESDENQLEIPFELSGQEGEDLQQELLRSAAEAIVSISSSGVESSLQKASCNLSEVSFSESLYWFAGIVVSSQAGKAENCRNHKKFPSDEIDYFEAMTLKLTETKVEEYCYRSNDQKKERTGAMSLPSQTRKGRTRRGRQHKDFQNEVLPGLASLSRNEVTEDLQTIGGLIEAARRTGLARYVGRNCWARGKRWSCISTSNLTESMVKSSLKQKTCNSKLDFDGSSIGWGNITRRRRGQRYPARKPPCI